jgi:hypothetical protein
MSAPAPIALFAYNRLWHTRKTVEALRANDGAAESDMVIYSDGPKRPEDAPKVEALRGYLKGITGFKSVTLVERAANLGLAQSIISGVTETLARTGRVIVLEDDMVTSPHFLRYMNEGLELYRDDPAVASITAYIYPVASPLPQSFFLKGADCWGWATWSRAWARFEPDGRKLLAELERGGLTREFDHGGAFPYTRMLRRQIQGKNDSWAIRWYASTFLAGMVSLYPGVSLLHNIGNDGEGTHARKTGKFDVRLAERSLSLERLPAVPDPRAARAVRRYFLDSRRSFGALVRRLFEAVRP